MTVHDDDRIVREAYDRVPYDTASHHYTHPAHLAPIAILNGLSPAPPERCRVLELGCADGINLVAMATDLPHSRFVGIDLSPRHVEAGEALVAELGLANVELRAMSILDVGADLGAFDYVVCHGVFSWVTPVVQEQILAVFREHLAPHGIAYVSYNTYPGWHTQQVIREALLYHTAGIDEPHARMRSAQELVRVLGGAASDDVRGAALQYARLLFEQYAERPSYLLHEYLEQTNAPIYFHELAERARSHGLQFVAEADPGEGSLATLPAETAAELAQLSGDPIRLEQYLDFVVNRTFRRSIFCHAERTLDRTVDAAKLRGLWIASQFRPASAGGGAEGEMRFEGSDGMAFTSTHPLAKQFFAAASARWPGASRFEELAEELRAPEAELAEIVASLHDVGAVDLHAVEPRCRAEAGEYPLVSALVRRQAASGPFVTNRHHRVVSLDDGLTRLLLIHLDGTRDRAALAEVVAREVAARRLRIYAGEEQIEDPQRLPALIEELIARQLAFIGNSALLDG